MTTLARTARSVTSVMSCWLKNAIMNPGEVRTILRCPGAAERRRMTSFKDHRGLTALQLSIGYRGLRRAHRFLRGDVLVSGALTVVPVAKASAPGSF